MSITVNNNKVNYITSANVSDGINFLNRKYSSLHIHETDSFNNTNPHTEISINMKSIIHVYGSISRDIVENSNVIYYSMNMYKDANHPTVIIPATGNAIDYFDFIMYIAPGIKYIYYKGHQMNHKYPAAKMTIDYNIDFYEV